MRATDESKRQAYDAGYAYYKAGNTTRQSAMAFNTSNMFPAEAWSWVRGWEQAQTDDRNGKLV